MNVFLILWIIIGIINFLNAKSNNWEISFANYAICWVALIWLIVGEY